MSFALRDYQNEARDAVLREFQRVNSTLLVLATGTGKTCIFSEVASNWADGRVMVIAHRQELISQAANKIREVTGELPAIEQGSQFSNESDWGRSQFIVASKDSLHPKRLARFSDIGLLIIDEAHHAAKKNKTYFDIIECLKRKNPSLKILGVTATPKRHDKSALGQIFQSCAYQFEIEPALDKAWLAPIIPMIIQVDSLDLSSVQVVRGDLDQKQLGKLLDEETTIQGMADAIVREAADRNYVKVFTKTVHQAKEISRNLNLRESHSAVWLSGDKISCPDHLRAAELKRFSRGEFKYLVSCSLFLEGFDEPRIDMIAMCRPTKSEGLYKQMLGRGTRTYPGCIDGLETIEARREAIANSPKPNVLVIDFVDNSRKHKLFSSIDVLGGKLDDGTRKAASNKVETANAKGKRITIDQAVFEVEADREAQRKAEEEERERKRQEREAKRKAKEAEEERRRAAVVAKANYRKETVNLFDYADAAPGERRIRIPSMPFGKHKGTPINRLHTAYIKTFLEKVPEKGRSKWVHDALRAELDRRGHDAPVTKSGSSRAQTENQTTSYTMATEQQKKVLAKYGKPTNVTAGEACRMICEINEYLKQSRHEAVGA